jgi:hypothetical protein
MKKFGKLAIAAAASLVVSAAQADINIDLFDGPLQGPITQVTSTDPLLWAAQTNPAIPTIAGGYRDIAVKKTNAVEDGIAGTRAFVNNGIYNWSVDAGVTGLAIVRWDGDLAGSGTVDAQGGVSNHFVSSSLDVDGIVPVISLGMADSFLFDVLVSDLDFTFWFELYDTAGEYSKFKLQSQAHFNAVSTPIPVSAFAAQCAGGPSEFADPNDLDGDDAIAGICSSASFDIANIGAIQLILESVNDAGSVDLRVSALKVVPEPGSLALVGLGLLGAAGAGMRRRRA